MADQTVACLTPPLTGTPAHAILEGLAEKLWAGAEGTTSEDAEKLLRHLAMPLEEPAPNQAAASRFLEAERLIRPGSVAHRAEARYRVLVEQIPAVTFMAALDKGLNEMYVSPQIERMLGYTQKEWLEDPILWYSRLHPSDRERWHVEFARTCATGMHFQSEYRFLARDGRVVWVHGEARMVRDDEGRPLFLQGIAFDITVRKAAEEALRRSQAELEALVGQRTVELREAIASLHTEIAERKRAEETLRDQEARLRSVVETAVDAIVVIDESGVVEAFNPAAQRLFGYAAHEVIGANVRLLMPSPYRDEHDGYLARYVATGEKRIIGTTRELIGRRKDGSAFPMELSVSEMVLGQGRHFTGIVRDISERRQAEERLASAREEKLMAETASRAKSEFLSRMSHELRTPLNAILGFAQILEMNPLDNDQQECLGQILRGGKHLLTLINEVLDIAQIEAGRVELSVEPVRVGVIVRDVVDLIRSLAAQRGIHVRVDLADSENLYVQADNQKLRQVLLNLLSNAVKYNREHGEVCISCERPAEKRLRFVVTDTGQGIAADKLGRLFTPFDRLDAEATGVEGSGLGLVLSRNLVELMKGALTVASQPGQGSRFCVELPEAEPPAESAPAFVIPAERRPDAAPVAQRTILYIEDNLDNLRLVRQILAHRRAFRLLSSMRSTLGIELAREHRPDLILLDIHMPDPDGAQVLALLKADPATQAIPVVIVSADATPRQMNRLLAAGAADYITKPIDVEKFLAFIDDFLKTKNDP